MRVDIQNKPNFLKALFKVAPHLKKAEYSGITIDTRNIKPGDIFLAFKGEKSDGHNYINQAELSGAEMAVVESPVDTSLSTLNVSSTQNFLMELASEYRKFIKCPVVGITGSNGKTTTKDLLSHVLSFEMDIMSTRGNFNSTIGVPLSIFECGETHNVAIIEMGASMPGEIEYICNILQPDMGVITNVYEAHLENFGNIQEVANTKSALFSSLDQSGTAFVNLDDPFISNLPTDCKRVTYSFTQSSDFQGSWSAYKQNLIINNISISLAFPSETMGMNSLAVFSIASHLGMQDHIIKSQLESFQLPTGRGNIIKIRDIKIINDSYNANLESARSGIDNLILQGQAKRKIAVIGDMLELGDVDKDHHQILGKYLTEKEVDAVFAFGELTQHTIKAMNGSSNFHQFYDNKDDLISELKSFISKGDVIYIKGSRGMKMEEVIEGLEN